MIGVVAMSMVYALYYRMYRPDPLWKYGILFAFFYTAVLVWQLPIAIANLSGHALGDPRMLNPATATSLGRRAVTRKAFFKPGDADPGGWLTVCLGCEAWDDGRS